MGAPSDYRLNNLVRKRREGGSAPAGAEDVLSAQKLEELGRRSVEDLDVESGKEVVAVPIGLFLSGEVVVDALLDPSVVDGETDLGVSGVLGGSVGHHDPLGTVGVVGRVIVAAVVEDGHAVGAFLELEEVETRFVDGLGGLYHPAADDGFAVE